REQGEHDERVAERADARDRDPAGPAALERSGHPPTLTRPSAGRVAARGCAAAARQRPPPPELSTPARALVSAIVLATRLLCSFSRRSCSFSRCSCFLSRCSSTTPPS